MGDQEERDILEVIVRQDKCDEIFEFIFEAKINEPHGGIMSQSLQNCTSSYLTSLGKKNKLELKALKLN